MFNKGAMTRKYSRRSDALYRKGKPVQECQRNTDIIHLVNGTDKERVPGRAQGGGPKTAASPDRAYDELRKEVTRGWRRADLVEAFIAVNMEAAPQ